MVDGIKMDESISCHESTNKLFEMLTDNLNSLFYSVLFIFSVIYFSALSVGLGLLSAFIL